MNNQIKYNYIIYHNYCIDGFTGFYLFIKTKLWEPKPIVYPDQPHTNEVPPGIDGKNVIIIDVAYKADIVKEVAKRANKLLFIDHHISIRDDIKKLKLPTPHELVYDEAASGAGLVWRYFHKKQKMPSFVKYVEDNDIGKWKYKETLPFISALEVNFKLDPIFDNLKKWDKLLDNNFTKNMVYKGIIYSEYKNFLIKKSSKRYVIKKFPSNKFRKNMMMNHKKSYIVAVIGGGHALLYHWLGKRLRKMLIVILLCYIIII